jgi:hypothetical protein
MLLVYLNLSARCWRERSYPRGDGDPNGTKTIIRHLHTYFYRSILYFIIYNSYSHIMSFRIASTFRLARSAVSQRAALPTISRVRTLSTSPVWRASEAAPQDPMADPKFQSFFDKIKNHQGAVDAMLKVGEVMKNKGMSPS